jgi:hypothetical protein
VGDLAPSQQPARSGVTHALGCMAKGLSALFLVGMGLGLVVILLAALSQRGECLAEPALHSTDEASSTLDADHPIAQRQLALQTNAAALPAESPAQATISIVLGAAIEQTTDPGSPSIGSGTSMPIVTMALIRHDTGAVILYTDFPPAWERQPWQGYRSESVTIDCLPGQDCERSYDVRVSAPGLPAGASISVTSTVRADIRYSSGASFCGHPDGAVLAFISSQAELLPSSRVAVAGPIGRQDSGGSVVARHITVSASAPDASAASAPETAFARLSIVEADQDSSAPSWRPWVRVIADDGEVALADEWLGRSSFTIGNSGTLEFPVLAGCPKQGPCTKGYWVIFQSAVETTPGDYSAASTPSLGRLSWTVDAVAVFDKTTTTVPSIKVSADNLAPGLVGTTTRSSEPISDTLDHPGTPTAIDVTITVPDHAAPTNGLNPLAASALLFRVSASGYNLSVHLGGPGADPLSAYFNGNGSVDLMAHPFGQCSLSGPCSAQVQLIGTFPPDDQHSPPYTSAELKWTLDLIGVPAETTFVVGDPLPVDTDVNASTKADYVPWLAVGLATIGTIATWVLLTRISRSRRRS